MLSWAIYKKQSLEKRHCLLYFALGSCHEKVFYKIFTRIYQELLETTLKFTCNFFRWEFYHKNQVHGRYHPYSNIFHKTIIILKLIYLYIEPEQVWFFVNSWTNCLNKRNLDIKLLKSRKIILWCYCEYQIYLSCKLSDRESLN